VGGQGGPPTPGRAPPSASSPTCRRRRGQDKLPNEPPRPYEDTLWRRERRTGEHGAAATAAVLATYNAESAAEMPAAGSDSSGTARGGAGDAAADTAATAATAAPAAAAAAAAEPLLAGTRKTGVMVGRSAAHAAAAADCAAAKRAAAAAGTAVGGGAQENPPAERWPRRKGSCGWGAWRWGGDRRRWEAADGVGTASDR